MRDRHENDTRATRQDTQATRRDFLRKLSLLGTAGVTAPVILSACGGGGDADTAAPMDMPDESMAMEDAPMDGEFSCMDTSGLTDAEVAQREATQYVDATPDMEKTCSNCQLYTAPAADAQCGGCTVIKGPVHPNGYCTLWVTAAA